MEIRQTLIDISNDARGWLNAWSGDFTEDEAMRTSIDRPGPNPLAWQLGHLAGVEDDVHQLFSGHASLLPPEMKATCATGSPPPTGSTRFPSLAELREHPVRTHAGLLSLVNQADASQLDQPPLVENKYFRTLGQAIYEVALHENYHVGEIACLRKLLGKSRIG